MTLHIVQNESEYDEWHRTLDEFSRLHSFEPAHMGPLLDAIWLMNIKIHQMRSRRDDLQAIVLRHCIKTGETVEGKKATGYAREYLDDVIRGEPKWATKLEIRKR